MSVLGGKAASAAAVTGAGSSLRDRFPTLEKQQERIQQLEGQADYYRRHKILEPLKDLSEQIDEIRALSLTHKRIRSPGL